MEGKMAKKVVDADEDVEIGSKGFVEEFLIPPRFDEDGVQATSGIGLDGKEVVDPVPMAPPVGFNNPPDLAEMMRTMIRQEAYQRSLDEAGFDTEEEAADFDIDDDPLPPLTFHEAILAPPPAGPPASSPPSPAAPQVTAEKEGGEGAVSPDQTAPAAPSAAPPVRST